MKKSEATIKKKWEKKTEEMRIKAKFRFDILIQNRRKSMDRKFDYEIEKYNRKRDAYIRKKEEEYKDVLAYLDKGYKIADIAKLTGTSTSTVQRLKREFKIR